MAAEVAIAWRTGTLHHVMNGTDIEPPPTQNSDEAVPIAVPTRDMPTGPGNARGAVAARIPKPNCTAIANMNTTNMICSVRLARTSAIVAPHRPPITMPG